MLLLIKNKVVKSNLANKLNPHAIDIHEKYSTAHIMKPVSILGLSFLQKKFSLKQLAVINPNIVETKKTHIQWLHQKKIIE